MRPLPETAAPNRPTPLEIRVHGPDCEPMTDADLRRLFPGGALTEARLDRLRTWPRILVTCGGRTVAAATCQKTETELRVPEVGMDATCGCSEREVIDALLDAVELAGLAGGCRRIVLLPPKVSLAHLQRRGYAGITERCAGGWVEKNLV